MSDERKRFSAGHYEMRGKDILGHCPIWGKDMILNFQWEERIFYVTVESEVRIWQATSNER